MPKEFINPDNVYQPDFFSQAVKAGNTIYLSGMVGWDEKKNVVGEGDINAQAAQAFENTKRVLEAAGATMADIVKMNIYFTNFEESMNIAEAFMQYFQPPFPAITGLEISSFQESEFLIEIDIIAVID